MTKLNPTGTALVYSTYLGGTDYDIGDGIAVDTAGNAYVTGTTDSTNFPTTPGAYQTTYGGDQRCLRDEAEPDGHRPGLLHLPRRHELYDIGTGIAVDTAGDAYVTGVTGSTDFPTTPGAFQTTYVAAVAGDSDRLRDEAEPDGHRAALLHLPRRHDGSGGYGIAVDTAGNAYVTGTTDSTDFPTTAGAFQTTFRGANYDVFVTKLNPTGTALVYSTYLGGRQ